MIAAAVTFYIYHLNHLYSLMLFLWLHSDSDERGLVEILTVMRSNPLCHSRRTRTQNSSCSQVLISDAFLLSGQNAEMLLHSGILYGLTFCLGLGSCHCKKREEEMKWWVEMRVSLYSVIVLPFFSFAVRNLTRLPPMTLRWSTQLGMCTTAI